jgi:hypothetical protein
MAAEAKCRGGWRRVEVLQRLDGGLFKVRATYPGRYLTGCRRAEDLRPAARAAVSAPPWPCWIACGPSSAFSGLSPEQWKQVGERLTVEQTRGRPPALCKPDDRCLACRRLVAEGGRQTVETVDGFCRSCIDTERRSRGSAPSDADPLAGARRRTDENLRKAFG